MVNKIFNKIEDLITKFGWFPFGKEEFECPGLDEKEINFYKQNKKLPKTCDECYKALIFWEGYFSEENVLNFLKLINSFAINYRGKFNKNVVVFYFRDKDKMLAFIDYLNSKMKEFSVIGRTQWRRACKEYQEIYPSLWKNAKEFIPTK